MNAFLLALVAAHVPIFLPSPSPAAPVLFVPPLGTAVVPDMPPDPDGEVLVPPNVTPQTKPVPTDAPLGRQRTVPSRRALALEGRRALPARALGVECAGPLS